VTASGWWNEDASATAKLVIAAATLAVVAWDLARRRGRRAPPAPPSMPASASPSTATPASAAPSTSTPAWAATALKLLGALGLLAYFNFGAFHFGGIYVHLWDSLHHTLGAKYVDEIGYDGLYECIALADAEDPRLGPGAAHRVLTDLRTNRMTTAADVVTHPERCHARFSSARWVDFKRDVAFFRARFPDADWQNVTTDHGFNASPVWLLIAHPLVGDDPITMTRLRVLAALDPLIMLAAFGALAWAFGWERAALCAVVWGTYFPGRLWWTGGSFLRWDWLAALLAGLALLRRDRPFAAGALLAYAALSRIFPAFALLGAALAGAASIVRRQKLDRAIVRVLAGGAVTAALLVPLASAVRSGPGWSEFTRNLAKHTSTASPNRMGLGMVVAFDSSSTHRALERRGREVRGNWEVAQARSVEHRRGLWIALAVVGVVAMAFAVRDQPAWAACLLGLLLIPLGRPLACYYYAFVAALPLASERRSDVAGIVVALALASGIVARLTGFAIDEQYAAQSLLVVLAFAFMASAFVERRREPKAEM
jgi:hypothetical protein